MKGIRIICLLLCTAMLLSSCHSIKTVELGERLIIEAIGVDVKDEEILVTLLTLDTEKGNSENSSETAEQTKIYNFSEKTVGKSLALANGLEGLTPLYSHARILLMGSTAAREKLNEILDFFLREYTTRSDILVAVAKGEAKDILTANLGGATNGAIIKESIEAGGEKGQNTVVPLYKFVNLMLSETDTAYCPLLDITSSGKEEQKELIVKETAFFGKDKLLFSVPEDLTRGLLLLKGDAENQTVSVKNEEGEITLNTVKCKTKINPRLDGGKARFTVETQIIADITEYASDSLNEISIQDIDNTQKLLAEKVKEYEERALNSLFREKGCDICRFSRIVLLKHPGFYEKYISNMSLLTDFDIKVKAKIRRSGRERLKDIS